MRPLLKSRTHGFAGARLLSLAAIASVLLRGGEARAQSTLRNPGDRAPYRAELEPHLVLGLFDPPGDGTGPALGGGFRASFELVPRGFVPTINDSVSIGVGADFAHYYGRGPVSRGVCTRYAPGPAGTNVCVRVSQHGSPSDYGFFPVVMQWNFFLTRQWSVFGEPGLAVYWFDYQSAGVAPVFDVGGRYHFGDRMTLTLRFGYPTTLSVGVSFWL